MNFGLASLRELIEDFLTNSGGRRGRQREQRREESDEFDGEPDAESATETQSQEAEPESESDEGPSESEPDERDNGGDSGDGGFFGRGSSDDEDDIDDLFYRIEELEAELQDKENELGSVQDSQQHVAEQVEEMNDRVQRLLGVYDQVTDDVNPFTGEGEAQNGFGVFGEDETDGDNASSAPGIESRIAADSTADDETVSFDDLKNVIEDAAAQSSKGERIAFDETDETNDTRVEVQATESVDEPESAVDAGADAGAGTDSSDDGDADDADDPDDVTLSTLADTYATDIIVFEWLTQLVRTGGSAATLRAISYYAEIGWIGEDVKTHLETVLSGPDLDMHVDPGSAPEELTAEDHADSYTYIMKLQEIHETKAEVEPDPDRASESGLRT